MIAIAVACYAAIAVLTVHIAYKRTDDDRGRRVRWVFSLVMGLLWPTLALISAQIWLMTALTKMVRAAEDG